LYGNCELAQIEHPELKIFFSVRYENQPLGMIIYHWGWYLADIDDDNVWSRGMYIICDWWIFQTNLLALNISRYNSSILDDSQLYWMIIIHIGRLRLFFNRKFKIFVFFFRELNVFSWFETQNKQKSYCNIVVTPNKMWSKLIERRVGWFRIDYII
jgi:hypothetical protein